MFSNSNLTIRFLVGAVVASLLLLLAIGGGTGFIAVLYLNNQITSLSPDFAALSGPDATTPCRSISKRSRHSRISSWLAS